MREVKGCCCAYVTDGESGGCTINRQHLARVNLVIRQHPCEDLRVMLPSVEQHWSDGSIYESRDENLAVVTATVPTVKGADGLSDRTTTRERTK